MEDFLVFTKNRVAGIFEGNHHRWEAWDRPSNRLYFLQQVLNFLTVFRTHFPDGMFDFQYTHDVSSYLIWNFSQVPS